MKLKRAEKQHTQLGIGLRKAFPVHAETVDARKSGLVLAAETILITAICWGIAVGLLM